MRLFLIGMFCVAMLIPTVGNATDAWYVDDERGWVDIRSEAFGRGSIKCRVPNGQTLRQEKQDWSRWIYVRWNVGTYNNSPWEWDFKDAVTGKYCPLWNRRGWVDKTHGINRR